MAHAHILTDCTITSSTPSCPTPTPSPSPIPTNAFLSLDVTAGDPNTQITVNGGAFLPNESMTLIWDPPNNKVAGGAVADASGNFTTHVKPFTGDPPGLHHLCASVPPNPCASSTLQAVAGAPPGGGGAAPRRRRHHLPQRKQRLKPLRPSPRKPQRQPRRSRPFHRRRPRPRSSTLRPTSRPTSPSQGSIRPAGPFAYRLSR